jgi:CheY-like chemotaxis protein
MRIVCAQIIVDQPTIADFANCGMLVEDDRGQSPSPAHELSTSSSARHRERTLHHSYLPTAEETTMPTTNDSEPVKRFTVLAVDDDRLLLSVVRNVLEEDGHRVLTAASGFRALDTLSFETVDLVVLDVLMPGLNGIEVCDELRRSAHTSQLPILFCTGSPQLLPRRVTSARQAAVEVLAKPFEGASLQEAVRRLLSSQATLTS